MKINWKEYPDYISKCGWTKKWKPWETTTMFDINYKSTDKLADYLIEMLEEGGQSQKICGICDFFQKCVAEILSKTK